MVENACLRDKQIQVLDHRCVFCYEHNIVLTTFVSPALENVIIEILSALFSIHDVIFPTM